MLCVCSDKCVHFYLPTVALILYMTLDYTDMTDSIHIPVICDKNNPSSSKF